MPPKPTLLFVYNADTGFFNKLTDFAHKIISPKTYNCQLCAITHSNFGMKEDWQAFLDGLDYRKEFLYRDEVEKAPIPSRIDLPAILLKKQTETTLLVSAAKIRDAASMDELKSLLNEALTEHFGD